MGNSNATAAQEQAMFLVRCWKEAKAARERYEATGELQDMEQVAPTIDKLQIAVLTALDYVRPLQLPVETLPKRFPFCGVSFRLLFPAEGMVQIVCPITEEILTAGFKGWSDPMKAGPTTSHSPFKPS